MREVILPVAVSPPAWQTGTPPEGVLLLGHSDVESRRDSPPELYVWTGTTFQSLIGWYDNAITHWIATRHETKDQKAQVEPEAESSANRARLAARYAKRQAILKAHPSKSMRGGE